MGVNISLNLKETKGIDRIDEPISFGVPLKKGLLDYTDDLCIADGKNKLNLQSKALSHWPDKSIKWLLVDFKANIKKKSEKKLRLINWRIKDTEKIEISNNKKDIFVKSESLFKLGKEFSA